MPIYHRRSKRKPTGGRSRPLRKKKLRERGREFIGTTVAEEDSRRVHERQRGGNEKLRLRFAAEANVTDPEKQKNWTTKILSVKENPANTDYVRRNIITKGAVIETEKGPARVTSRPNQDGIVNAVLVKE